MAAQDIRPFERLLSATTLAPTTASLEELMRLLIAYDGSAPAQTACNLVSQLRLPPGSQITLANVTDGDPAPRLDEIASALRSRDRSCITRVLRGHPASALLEEAGATGMDLIVIGNRGHGPIETILLGSVSTEVVDHAPCPVLVTRHDHISRVLVGVDGSPSSDSAVATLAAWPVFGDVPVRVLGVLEPAPAVWQMPLAEVSAQSRTGPDDPKRLELTRSVDWAAAMLARSGFHAEPTIRTGHAAAELVHAALDDGADLIVVGTRGLGTLSRLVLGSVARGVLLHSVASVLVVRPVRQRIPLTEGAVSLAPA